MFRYKIIPDKSLVIRHFKGYQNPETIYNQIINCANDKNYRPELNILNDFRDAIIDFNQQSILHYVDKLKEYPDIYFPKKVIFLTGSPNQVVFGVFIDKMKQEPKIDLRIVSTLEMALHHLDIRPNDYLFIENQLSELKSL